MFVHSLKELSALPPTRKPKIPIRAADANNWHTESSATHSSCSTDIIGQH